MKYLYQVTYEPHEEALCKLEIRTLFGISFKDKVFTSERKINPSISPYIKHRLALKYVGSFEKLLEELSETPIDTEAFRVSLLNNSKEFGFQETKRLCKEVGLRILGNPNYEKPLNEFGLFFHKEVWYFGELVPNDYKWRLHNDKPHSYSSSLGIHLGKVLVNLAGVGDYEKKIIDPCCGAGTVLLEGCYAGYNITGREIVYKVSEHARNNLKYFGYDVEITTGDIKDIDAQYDAAIVDLPYGILSKIGSENYKELIHHASRISTRTVIVASRDISELIEEENLNVIDHCEMRKNKKHKFIRYIWICEKADNH